MNKVMVKGHEINVKITKSAYDRKAVMFVNKIVEELGKLGICRDDIEVRTDVLGNKNVPAVLEFWGKGHYMRFSYSMTKRFIDNLYVIMKVIEIEVEQVIKGEKNLHEFFYTFAPDSKEKNIGKEIRNAKTILGVNETENDIETINKAYKVLAKLHHPDLGGDINEFQKINKAHKLIRREMGL